MGYNTHIAAQRDKQLINQLTACGRIGVKMKLFFKETGVIETLAIIDPRTGCDYIFDFMGNTGAFTREFEKTDENADFAISQADYDWWAKVVADNQALENRIAELVAEHGYDRVMDVVTSNSSDLEDYAAAANAALDEEFGN